MYQTQADQFHYFCTDMWEHDCNINAATYVSHWGKGQRDNKDLDGGHKWTFMDGSKVWVSDDGTRVQLRTD